MAHKVGLNNGSSNKLSLICFFFLYIIYKKGSLLDGWINSYIHVNFIWFCIFLENKREKMVSIVVIQNPV